PKLQVVHVDRGRSGSRSRPAGEPVSGWWSIRVPPVLLSGVSAASGDRSCAQGRAHLVGHRHPHDCLMADGYFIGVDTGGTFTDCVVVYSDGHVTTAKAASTPPDFAEGVLDAL